MNTISRLMRPQRVAVIGASADVTKTAGRPVAYLLKHGFSGAVYPVNPKATEICGLPCYPDIASLPSVPDVGIPRIGVTSVGDVSNTMFVDAVPVVPPADVK